MIKKLYSVIPKTTREWINARFAKALLALPPVWRIRLTYLKSFGRWPNLRHPKLYSELLQVRKLDGKDYSKYIDKIEAKKFVAKRWGQDIIIPSYYEGDRLPDRNLRN
jgi:hypothetical protein